MTRTDRLYALVEELRAVAPRPRSARWLAEKFDVSSRTIERDLSALQQGGVPIWAEPGRTGGYSLDPAHTLAPLGFTVDEALAVMISLGALTTSPFRDAAASALRKVVAVIDDRSLKETVELATRIHLLDEHRPNEAPRHLAEALRTGQVLQIAYVDRAGVATVLEPMGFVGKGTDRTVSPGRPRMEPSSRTARSKGRPTWTSHLSESSLTTSNGSPASTRP